MAAWKGESAESTDLPEPSLLKAGPDLVLAVAHLRAIAIPPHRPHPPTDGVSCSNYSLGRVPTGLGLGLPASAEPAHALAGRRARALKV